MCGRFKRGSDKQRVAEAFKVNAGLDETVFDEGDDLRPQSMQPVIYTNDGERQIELMRWAFKLPDRLLFNARSEGIERSKFFGKIQRRITGKRPLLYSQGNPMN
jgi:putative SOS response-associated peptidase YedK